ncbi:hypothetical protein [Pseudomonas aeruginosa]|uniref:hypothetical protein n=1 Tax=Pseudomonas aeruginosa TaxID=287 RepID=UPI00406C9830
MSNEDWNELDESYRSALSGALETAHPAVEQAGGDERAAFEAWLAQAMSKKFEPEFDLAKYEDSGEYRYSPAAAYWKAWQARAALAQPSPAQAEQPTADDYEEVLADHRRLVREMDVLLNGEACAAKQAMLCDLVSQVEAEVRKSGQPLLVSAERYRWLRNDDNWGADDSEGQGTSKWANLGELSGTDFDAYLDQLRGSNPVMDIDPEHSKAIAKRGRDAIVAQAEGAPVIGCLCGMPMTEGRHSPGGCTSLEEFAPNPAQAQSEQAEAERPEVVGYRVSMPDEPELGHWLEEEAESEPQIQHHEPLMSVAQHDASVARWAEMFNRVEQERDAALVRVAELEKQEPVAYVLFRDGEVYYETDDNIVISNTPGDETDLYRWLPVFTAPAAQAQQLHDLDKQCRDDVARALGLRPSQERGFAWSYLLASIKSCVKASEDAAQAQHSVPEGWMRVPIEPLLNMMSDKDHDTRITAERQLLSILAAAPGKEGV